MKNTLAAAAVIALALGGCAGSENAKTTDSNNSNNGASSLDMKLTLPSGLVINTVNYAVSGPATRTGVVNVEQSTQLRFRVGNLPIASGYTMALAATTTTGVACAGSAGFSIADNNVTTLNMQLVCGNGTTYEIDDRGDITVNVSVTNDAGVVCPAVLGVSALPLEVAVGGTIQLEGYLSSASDTSVAWAGPGGTFSAATASATNYVCTTGGDHDVTFTATKAGCTPGSLAVTVTCTGTSVPDAAVEPDATVEPDAAVVPDAAVEPDATVVPDAAVEPDATVVPDAAVEPDSSVPASRWGSAACETCVRTQCADYQGFDLAGPCFGNGVSPAFSQKCSDAYFCSRDSADNCAYNPTRGPVGCFCGENVIVDACQQGTVQGNCQAEWYAATECATGDFNCVLNLFQDLSLPSGNAYFALGCEADVCASVCPQ